MFKSERGNIYVNWFVGILIVMILAAITIRVFVGENGLIQQWKEREIRNQTEKNIIIELMDEK